MRPMFREFEDVPIQANRNNQMMMMPKPTSFQSREGFVGANRDMFNQPPPLFQQSLPLPQHRPRPLLHTPSMSNMSSSFEPSAAHRGFETSFSSSMSSPLMAPNFSYKRGTSASPIRERIRSVSPLSSDRKFLNPLFTDHARKETGFPTPHSGYNKREVPLTSTSYSYDAPSTRYPIPSGHLHSSQGVEPKSSYQTTSRLSIDSKPVPLKRALSGRIPSGKGPSQKLIGPKPVKNKRNRIRRRGKNISPNKGKGNAEGSRVSALKRLGPKLTITDRLGAKAKKAIANSVKNSKSSSVKDDTTKKEGKSKKIPSNKDDDVEIIKEVTNTSPVKPSKNLQCPHCGASCTSNEEYTSHISGEKHSKAMTQLKYRLFVTLSNMRTRQKAATKAAKNNEGRKVAPIFCKTCKMVFHSTRADHVETKLHKSIAKFLTPSCSLCKVQFYSPMAFEAHNCSLVHLRRKKLVKNPKKLEQGLENQEFSIRDLVTVDEVGQVDENELETSKEVSPPKKSIPRKPIKFSDSSTSPPTVKKISSNNDSGVESSNGLKQRQINSAKKAVPAKKAASENETSEESDMNLNPDEMMGENYVKTIEMLFCEACHKFLPREKPENFSSLLEKHCKSLSHQNMCKKKVEEEKNKKFAFNEDELDYEPDEN